MTDASHIDYRASYNLEPRNDRVIQSIPALPGQQRLGRYGLATSRFFSRRSLLGSSASGLPPPAFTREPETLPETYRPGASRSRAVASGASRPAHSGVSTAQHRHSAQQAHPSSAQQRTRRPEASTFSHIPRQPVTSQTRAHARARTPRLPTPAQYPEIQKLRDNISRWQTQVEPFTLETRPQEARASTSEPRALDPRKYTRVDTDSSPEQNKDGIGTPNESSSGGGWVVRKIEVIPEGQEPPLGSVPYNWQGDDTPGLQRNSESGYEGGSKSSTASSASQQSRSSTSSSHSETTARSGPSSTQQSDSGKAPGPAPRQARTHFSRQTESQRQALHHQHREDVDVGTYSDSGHPVGHSRATGGTMPPEHEPRHHHPQPPPSAHLRQPPPGMRLEKIITTNYLPSPTAPPSSAKSSLASLPRLSSSAQVPLGQGLKAFVSDEASTPSIRSQARYGARDQPGYPQYPAAAASASVFTQRQLSDVPEQRETDSEQQPIRKIKTKYGEGYTRYEDTLPFESAQHYRPAAKSAQQPSFRDVRLADPDYAEVYEARDPGSHNSAQRRREKGKQPESRAEVPLHAPIPQNRADRQPTSTSKYSFEERDDDEAKRFARNLAEARQELRSIFSENIARSPSPEQKQPTHTGASNIESDDDDDDELLRKLEQEVGRKPEPLRLPYRSLATDLPKPQRQVDNPVISEDSEGDGDNAASKAMKKRMMYRKPPTPYAPAVDSTSGEESAPQSQTEKEVLERQSSSALKARRKKKRSRRELVSALKKPAEPTPRNTPAMGSDSRKSVHFGEATPAEVGGDYSPPPHSNTPDTHTTETDENALPPSASDKGKQKEQFGPIVRSREPSPDPEEYKRYHSKHKGKGKATEADDDEAVEAVLRDLPPPLPFDFSKLGASTSALDPLAEKNAAEDEDGLGGMKFDFTAPPRNGKQTRVSDTDSDEEEGLPAPPKVRPPRQKLELMTLPTVNREYRKLPAMSLAAGVKLCQGLSIYARIRELAWDYTSDLDKDINKRREKYWLPLADACEKLLMKIQKSLHDQTTTKLLPLFREILGQDEDPRENSIIFARRAVTAQIKQAWTFAWDAKTEYNDIVHGSDEILNAGGDQRNMEQKAIDGFRFAYVGLMHMIEYFRMLFDEINAITHAIRYSFGYLSRVPSPSELANFPDEQIAKIKDSRDDLVEWYDGLLAAIRHWKDKITYHAFEKQLTALRGLDRKWEQADDLQLGMIKALFCFGLCLPRSSREAIKKLEGKKDEKPSEKPHIKTEQPRKQAPMSQSTAKPSQPKLTQKDKITLTGELLPSSPQGQRKAKSTSSGKKPRKDQESDSDSSGLELPDLRRRPRSMHVPDTEQSQEYPPYLRPEPSGGGMADFLRQDPNFNALTDEEKLIVVQHMLAQQAS